MPIDRAQAALLLANAVVLAIQPGLRWLSLTCVACFWLGALPWDRWSAQGLRPPAWPAAQPSLTQPPRRSCGLWAPHSGYGDSCDGPGSRAEVPPLSLQDSGGW